MWHLLLLIAIVAACLWGVTQYGMESAAVVVEKYHVAKRFDGEHANLHLQLRIEQPEVAAGQVIDYALFWVPVTMVPDNIAEGDELRFRYQKKTVWFGIGQRTFLEKRAELFMDKFWNLFLNVPEERALTKREQRALDQVIGAFVP